MAGAHQVEIVIRANPEDVQNLVEHGPVLGGDTDFDVEPGTGGPHVPHHRAELDGLGARAEDEENAFHGIHSVAGCGARS
jgi:hypothetical protein